MKKKEVRSTTIDKLQLLEQQVKHDEETQIYQLLFTTSEWQKASTIGLTLSNQLEVDTSPIIENAMLQQKNVVIPRTLPDHQMEFVMLNDKTEFEISDFGIKEPIGGVVVSKNKIDLMLVPGVAYSKQRQRVGFGGGYYDRYLADFSGDKISLALSVMLFDQATWQTRNHDIMLDKIISTQGEF